MNNFEAMNNFGSLEDGAAAARSKTALENSFDNNAALFDKDETVRVSGVSAQNSLETDAGYRPEKKAPSHSSPPPSRASLSPVPLSQQANSFSTESAQQQQPNLSASSAVLTPPNRHSEVRTTFVCTHLSVCMSHITVCVLGHNTPATAQLCVHSTTLGRAHCSKHSLTHTHSLMTHLQHSVLTAASVRYNPSS